jgi:hypothetical protein
MLSQIPTVLAQTAAENQSTLGSTFQIIVDVVGVIGLILIVVLIIGALPMIPDFLRYLRLKNM